MYKRKFAILFIIIFLINSFILIQPKNKKILFISNIKMKKNNGKKVSYYNNFCSNFNENKNYDANINIAINKNNDLNIKELKSIFYNISDNLFTNKENEFGKMVSENINRNNKTDNNIKYILFYNRQKINNLFLSDNFIVTDILLVKIMEEIEIKYDDDELNDRYRIKSNIEIVKNCRYLYSLRSHNIKIYASSHFSSLSVNNIKINYKDYNDNSKAFLALNDASSSGISKFKDNMNPYDFQRNYENSFESQKDVYGDRLYETTQDFTGLKLKDYSNFVKGNVDFKLNKQEEQIPKLAVKYRFEVGY